jgi:hypothetical protein
VPDEIVRLVRTQKNGWELGMHLVRLPDGGVLVHSPTWLGDDTFDRIEAVGPPRVLLAPNFFHHMSLGRFRERYPTARVVAGERAIPRLTKKGHADVSPVSAAAHLLPKGAHFLECDGVKSGETLVSVETSRGRAWITCDGFFNVQAHVTGFMGAVLRGLKTTPNFCIGSTFLWLALDDKRAYRRFLTEALAREPPRTLYFSHGSPLEAEDLPARIEALAEARIGG